MSFYIDRRGRETGGAFTAKILNIVGVLLVCTWSLAMIIGVVVDQIALLPPEPPTIAESAAARPEATRRWAIVYRALLARLQPPDPPELGAVWSTRSGQICGYIDDRESAVDNMKPFYTIGLDPHLRSDDESQYLKYWLKCRYDVWVELHEGTEKTGFCATHRGQTSVLGRLLCRDR